jgi:CBS-domain-containing membrane protein
VVDNDIDPLHPETDLTEITRRMATYDLVAMPVVDATNRLVGAVTVDDVLDHSLPRDWRDRDTQAAEDLAATLATDAAVEAAAQAGTDARTGSGTSGGTTGSRNGRSDHRSNDGPGAA